MLDDVDGDEAIVPRMPNLPPEPSARQIAEHELTGHAVYRSWCRHCVASKGRAHAHSSREDGELPEIGIDYGFFGRDREDVLPILCVKCRNSSTGCMGATLVDRKEASGYASSFLTAFIKGLITSSNEIAEVLGGDGRWKREKRFVHMTGKSKTGSEYLASFVVAMLRANKRQLISDGAIKIGEMHFAGPVPDEGDNPSELKGEWRVDGMWIDPKLLIAGRK